MLNLPSFKKTYEDTNRFLTLNINAKDVKCLSFYLDGDIFKITGFGSQDLPEGCVRNGMILDQDTVVEAIKTSVEIANRDSVEKIKKVIVGIDGGVTTGITTTLRMKRPTAEPITPDEVKTLYEKVSEIAFTQAKNRIIESTGDPGLDLQTITTSDVYIKIDGQKVAVLEGQRGQNVEIAVFNSFVPDFHIKSLQDSIKKAHLDMVAIGSQMYSLVEWIKSVQEESLDFVFINISEDSTDVGAIFGGGITSTRSLNIGYNHFIESIINKMGLPRKSAESVVKMYNADKLSESEASVIRSCLKEIIDIWVDGLKILFEDFTGVKTFSSKIYVSGCGVDIKDVMASLQEADWTKTVPFKDSPVFNKVSFMENGKIINSTDQELTTDWIYLASTSIIYKEIIGG